MHLTTGIFTALKAQSRSLLGTSKFHSEVIAIVKLTDDSAYPIKDDFLRAAASQGIPVVDDLQDLKTAHGAEQWLKWINRDVSVHHSDGGCQSNKTNLDWPPE